MEDCLRDSLRDRELSRSERGNVCCVLCVEEEREGGRKRRERRISLYLNFLCEVRSKAMVGSSLK